VGDVTLIPACDHDDPPVVFVHVETIMTLRYDVMADREAEITRPWDEIEIRRRVPEADLERQAASAPR
jgi:hypothetical protein